MTQNISLIERLRCIVEYGGNSQQHRLVIAKAIKYILALEAVRSHYANRLNWKCPTDTLCDACPHQNHCNAIYNGGPDGWAVAEKSGKEDGQ